MFEIESVPVSLPRPGFLCVNLELGMWYEEGSHNSLCITWWVVYLSRSVGRAIYWLGCSQRRRSGQFLVFEGRKKRLFLLDVGQDIEEIVQVLK